MNALQYDDMRLVNFRVPNHLRIKFNMLCQCNHSTMTKELTRFMSSYISQEYPKAEQLGFSNPSNDIPISTHTKPSRISTKNDGWGQSSKTSTTTHERVGNLVKNPFTHTWEEG